MVLEKEKSGRKICNYILMGVGAIMLNAVHSFFWFKMSDNLYKDNIKNVNNLMNKETVAEQIFLEQIKARAEYNKLKKLIDSPNYKPRINIYGGDAEGNQINIGLQHDSTSLNNLNNRIEMLSNKSDSLDNEIKKEFNLWAEDHYEKIDRFKNYSETGKFVSLAIYFMSCVGCLKEKNKLK